MLFTRRKALAGIGVGFIASLVPRFLYSRDIKNLPNNIVTYLNPETILANHGVAGNILKEKFDSRGDWRLSYRIWTAIGAGQADNNAAATIGYLTAEKRSNQRNPGIFDLIVRQKILQQDLRPPFKDDFHLMEARIRCNDDDFASPQDWEISHALWRENKLIDYCSYNEKGIVSTDPKGTIVKISVNGSGGHSLNLRRGTIIVSDLTMPALLPRILSNPASLQSKQIVLLEKLRLRKDNQVIIRNQEDDYQSDSFGYLKKIEHRGEGILPYDYWLTEDGCPLFICTLHNAFIYDLNAEEKVEEICKTGRRRQFEDQ